MIRRIALLSLSLLACITFCIGQEPVIEKSESTNYSHCGSPSFSIIGKRNTEFKSITSKETDGGVYSWKVTILTSGGFFGVGRGNYSLTSYGELRKLNGPNDRNLVEIPQDVVLELSTMMSPCIPADVDNLPFTDVNPELQYAAISPSMCTDCYMTTMIIKVNRNDDVSLMERVTFTGLNPKRMPKYKREIYSKIMLLVDSKFEEEY